MTEAIRANLYCPNCKHLIGWYEKPLYGTVQGRNHRPQRVLVETLLYCYACHSESMVSQTIEAKE